MNKKWWWIVGGVVGLYFLFRKGIGTPETETGIGIGGSPRRGMPKSEGERRRGHQLSFGSKKVPPRGTGLSGR